MWHEYTVYPEAVKKAKASGLIKRVFDYDWEESAYSSWYHSAWFGGQIQDAVNNMKERGYFANIPKEEHENFRINLNRVNNEGGQWQVTKGDKTITQATEGEDTGLLLGDPAAEILKPDEFWRYKDFGFDTHSEFIGTIGAIFLNQMEKKDRYSDEEGLKWRTVLDDGRIMINKYLDDHNGDFRLNQKEITPYETVDPFGNQVNYRPTLGDDGGIIAGYHSVEVSFLATILKYANQNGLKSEILDSDGEEVHNQLSKGRALGNFAETYSNGEDIWSVKNAFIPFGIRDLPQIDEREENASIYGIPTINEESYFMYQKGDNLVFTYGRDGNPLAEFSPSDVDNLIRGVFLQAQRGKVRTHPNSLLKGLDYYLQELR